MTKTELRSSINDMVQEFNFVVQDLFSDGELTLQDKESESEKYQKVVDLSQRMNQEVGRIKAKSTVSTLEDIHRNVQEQHMNLLNYFERSV